MGFRHPAIRHEDLGDTVRHFTTALGVFIACCFFQGVEIAYSAVFSQEAVGCRPDGSLLPQIIIDPDSMQDLRTWTYDLGAGRRLEIQTNLAVSRQAEIDSLATIVGRCYGFLEAASGRQVPGGVLLYLLQFPQPPRYYRFQADVEDAADWNEVRIALLNTTQPLLGPGAAKHVTELIYDTLPHELTHSLLETIPTVRHDLDGQDSQGTRWFIDGVCEKLAKDFAASESPVFWRTALRMRHLDAAFIRPDLGVMVWQWGQSSDFAWGDESDLYGVSMLLVTAWLENMELDQLLNLMSRQGGDLAGDDLAVLLSETAGIDRLQLLARAQRLGLAMVPPANISLRQMHQ